MLRKLQIRSAREDDCEFIYSLRNSEDVRKNSFDKSEITFSRHKEWFCSALKRNDRLILIGELDSEPVGVVRFDVCVQDELGRLISIMVDSDYRGQGVGKQLLSMGLDIAIRKKDGLVFYAEIARENKASIKLFESQGFDMYDACENKITLRKTSGN